MNPPPRDEMNRRRPKIRDEKIRDAEDRPPSKALAPAFRVVDPPTDVSPYYRNLRSLPGYALGDALRPDDAALLCDSEEATVAVVSQLRPTDCAFVLRSDGAFTYALYEGPWSDEGQASCEGEGASCEALLFRLSDDGNFKVVARDELLGGRIKIPVLPGQGQGQDGGRRAPRRSSCGTAMRGPSTVESSKPSRRRFSSYALTGPRMDAVLEVQEWASRQEQDEESEASVLQGSGNKAPRRSSTRTEDPRPAAPTTEATVQGKKAPRRSSMKCHPTVEPSRPSRRRFSYAPGGQQRPQPPRTTGDLRPIRSLPKLSATAAAAASAAGRHRSFFVGDLFPAERVPVVDRSDNAAAVSRLEVGDAAFVKRSCGTSYSYAAVIRKDGRSVTFRVTDEGNTKTFPLSKAGRFVIVGDVVKASGAGAGAREEGSSDDGDETCGDETRGGSTIAALPSAPPPAGELLAVPSCLPKRKGGTGTASCAPPGKNASQRRDSKFSSSTSVTSLCSMASIDDDDDGDDGMFHESERAVIGDPTNAAPKASAAADTEPPRGGEPRGPPRGPSPTGSPKKKKPEHHRAGTKVLYRGPSGVLVEARILAAHHDDEMEPYYTIELSCGREKQTDEAHLVAATTAP